MGHPRPGDPLRWEVDQDAPVTDESNGRDEETAQSTQTAHTRQSGPVQRAVRSPRWPEIRPGWV
nr:hypothetical protein StreXyl84_75160 [Streptomyces sp. Xyl84]